MIGCVWIDRRSGRVFVFVDEAAERVAASGLRVRWYSQRFRVCACLLRWAKCKRAVRPMAVVMPRVLGKDLPKVSFTMDQQMVEALAP